MNLPSNISLPSKMDTDESKMSRDYINLPSDSSF